MTDTALRPWVTGRAPICSQFPSRCLITVWLIRTHCLLPWRLVNEGTSCQPWFDFH
ncbi:hypothetical protein CRENBAI_005646 [Crenichthys baileyi]|uniref:Uncharacterized protein n=1 Tax=Crenichthys baileyi TaxID=28760 RepID=A0AAV9R8S4_9TELE